MLDPALLREHLDDVRARLLTRSEDHNADLDRLVQADHERRTIIPELETNRRARKLVGERVARARKAGEDGDQLAELMRTGQEHGAVIKALEARLGSVEETRDAFARTLPNLPHASVPVGSSEADNVEIRRHGEPPRFDFTPRPHWELGPALGILDFERAVRMAASRFAVLTGAGARLARALINFMLDLHTAEHGYTEVEPPFLANAAALTGTGNLPKFEDDLFKVAGDWDLYLIPTAEVPLCNLHREEILDGRLLPARPASGARRGRTARTSGA